MELLQIDVAQYKPLSQRKNDRRCREGYAIIVDLKILECLIRPKGLKAQSATSIESRILENGDVRSQ